FFVLGEHPVEDVGVAVGFGPGVVPFVGEFGVHDVASGGFQRADHGAGPGDGDGAVARVVEDPHGGVLQAVDAAFHTAAGDGDHGGEGVGALGAVIEGAETAEGQAGEVNPGTVDPVIAEGLGENRVDMVG